MDNRPFIEAYRDTQQRLLDLMDFLSSLQDLSSLDVNGANLGDLLRGGLRVLLENQGMERCSVFLVRDGALINIAGLDWQDLMGAEAPAHQPRTGTAIGLRVGEGIMGLAAASGEVQRCDDCRSDPRFVAMQTGTPVGSLVCLPILERDQVLGVLNVSHPEPNYFDMGHERRLRLFSIFLGQAMSHWRHVHQMEAVIRERTEDLQRALKQAQELRERYEALAVVDDLTGLNNRRFFFPEAQAALARALRHAQSFAVLSLDLDHFKRVNDEYGHALGDQVLRDVASVLRAMLREGDILARFGGEEFVFALPSTDAAGAVQLARRIREQLGELSWDTGTSRLRVTGSIGISELKQGSESGSTQELLDRLLAQADRALYASKAAGRDRATVDPA